jgi:hypothetical protein
VLQIASRALKRSSSKQALFAEMAELRFALLREAVHAREACDRFSAVSVSFASAVLISGRASSEIPRSCCAAPSIFLHRPAQLVDQLRDVLRRLRQSLRGGVQALHTVSARPFKFSSENTRPTRVSSSLARPISSAARQETRRSPTRSTG